MTDHEGALDHDYPAAIFEEQSEWAPHAVAPMTATRGGGTISPVASRFVRAASYGEGSNGRVTRIVMHTMEAPLKDGTALAVARYFAAGAGGRNVSAHYCVDPGTAIACLYEEDRGYHAPPNGGSIGIEQAGYAASNVWDSGPGLAMLRRSADLATDLCRRHRLPVVWLSAADLKAGKWGITGHLEVGQAFGQTSHTDPGKRFPVATFLSMVRGGNPPPPPLPDKVAPMFQPPHVLQPIVDAEAAPEGGAVLLGEDGSIYNYGGARWFKGANGEPWFAGRKAARLDYVGGDRPWRITATSGETYFLPSLTVP